MSAAPRQLLTRRQAAEMIGTSVCTLDRWRQRSEGPRWARIGGRIRYRADLVEQWLDQQFGAPSPSPTEDACPGPSTIEKGSAGKSRAGKRGRRGTSACSSEAEISAAAQARTIEGLRVVQQLASAPNSSNNTTPGLVLVEG